MKLKTFIIMGLLSVSALGNCQTGDNSNVTELTGEQKDKLKDLHRMYQYFFMKPGIPEDAIVTERTEPLPWTETGEDIDRSHVKEWLSHAKLEVDEVYKRKELLLSLHGKFTSEENRGERYESPPIPPSENPYEMKIGPIKTLGNMRINLISHLLNTEGNTLNLLDFSRLDISDEKKELALLFLPIGYADSVDFKGGFIEVELLGPPRWKYTRISLLSQDEGREYEFDGVRFKVLKSVPGDVILECDKKDSEVMNKMEIIPIKGQKPMNRFGGSIYGGREVLQYYKNPEMGFGEWCVTYLNENYKSLGLPPEALKLATKIHYQPTKEELRHFHETNGETLAMLLVDNLMEISSKTYKEIHMKWVKKGYEAMVEFKGDYYKAMGCFRTRYGNDSEASTSFLKGAYIGDSYVTARLRPDWEIINRCTIELLDKYSSNKADSLRYKEYEHSEKYIKPIVARREVLTFLTDEDIKYLLKEIVKDESPNRYYWFKTNMDADAMYIYKPDESADQPLLKMRYQLRKDKPDVLFP